MVKNRFKARVADLQKIDASLTGRNAALARFLHAALRLFRLSAFSKYFRYLESSFLPFVRPESKTQFGPPIEVLFVTTKKDFQVLQTAISYAIDATSTQSKVDFVIIVPDHELELCKSLLEDISCSISFVPESYYIDETMLIAIRHRFKARSGWVIQQILKDLYVIESNSAGVLIVDSDTLLIEKRVWLENSGKQLLLPSWEFHLPYYRFLNALGVSEKWPQYTFVSHHMLMQPRIMREAFLSAGWKSKKDLVGSLVSLSEPDQQSPFCIEYELYGQYISRRYPHLVNLERWSNIGCARKDIDFDHIQDIVDRDYRGKYASISLHSYL